MTPADYSVELEKGGGLEQAVAKAAGSGRAVAEVIRLTWPGNLESLHVQKAREGQTWAVAVTFHARPGHTYEFEKLAVLAPDFLPGFTSAASKARDAVARGYAALEADHAQAWHELWRSDIRVEGNPNLQTAIHSTLFYLLESARAGSDFSIPPMGLSTAGYYGHVFWDADTYMFPVLLLLHPQIARPIIMFRSRTLDVARANAASHRYQGAMYPWEAGPEGVETTPRFAYQNALYENHVNADVALAAWQYYLATGDRSWLTQYGYPILRATADFWVSRVTYNREKDRYEIGKVVSVIESKIGVNNDPYTNAAAKKNLELASTAAGLLGQPVNPKWGEVAAKLYLPSTESVLIDYPLELPVSPEQRRANVQAALAARPRGAMMGGEFDSILAAESGDRASIDQLLPRSWQPYTRPPFQVLAETPSNQNVNFITGAGAFLQQFLFGYSGLRLGANGLEQRYPPVLPSSVRKLVLQGITIRGVRRTLTITGGRVE